MDQWLLSLGLTGFEAAQVTAIVFVAGLIRGFAGFALSAVVMAAASLIMAPVELLPVLWFLELAASIVSTRGGIRDGDMRVALWLTVTGMIGQPMGLYLTTTLPEEKSRLAALGVILALAMAQFSRLRLPWLATKPGLLGTGLVAGVVSGIAGVGGMVVALYVLAQQAMAASMRGTLILFLMLGSASGLFMFWLYDLMTEEAFLRGIVLSVPAGVGVMIGTRFFGGPLSAWYRPFCLILLITLALIGVARTVL